MHSTCSENGDFQHHSCIHCAVTKTSFLAQREKKILVLFVISRFSRSWPVQEVVVEEAVEIVRLAVVEVGVKLPQAAAAGWKTSLIICVLRH